MLSKQHLSQRKANRQSLKGSYRHSDRSHIPLANPIREWTHLTICPVSKLKRLIADLEKGDSEGYVQAYIEKCRSQHIPLVPLRKVASLLNSEKMELQYMSLGPRHVQVLCEALSDNTTVELLDLRSNGIDPYAAVAVAELAMNNPCIMALDVSENRISGVGCARFGEMLAHNCGLQELDLSDNSITDSDVRLLANGLTKNYQLRQLKLSRNSIEVEGSKQLARMLVENDTLQELDLSWNHIRGKGGIALARALKLNTGLVSLDLSWNGLGYEGCVALEDAISFNKYLRDLDVTANRINWEGAQLIAKGLRRNAVLHVLRLGLNTLTMTGVMDILRAVDTDASAVSYIDFEGQIISSKILFKIETIARRRPFTCRHEAVVDSEDIIGTRVEVKEDPLKLLFDFLSSRAIRIVDLYRMIDKENKQFCSRSKFIRSLKRMKVPLTEMELLKVTQRIDPKKTGKISYQMLAKGLRSLRVQLRDDEKKRQIQERREQEDQRRLLNQVGELQLDEAGRQRRSAARGSGVDTGRSALSHSPLGVSDRIFASPSPLGSPLSFRPRLPSLPPIPSAAAHRRRVGSDASRISAASDA